MQKTRDAFSEEGTGNTSGTGSQTTHNQKKTGPKRRQRKDGRRITLFHQAGRIGVVLRMITLFQQFGKMMTKPQMAGSKRKWTMTQMMRNQETKNSKNDNNVPKGCKDNLEDDKTNYLKE